MSILKAGRLSAFLVTIMLCSSAAALSSCGSEGSPAETVSGSVLEIREAAHAGQEIRYQVTLTTYEIERMNN